MIKNYFKTDKIWKRSLYLHPIALMILWDMWGYCFERNLEFLVTDTVSTLEEDAEISRVSSTHRTARAFDLRNKSWSLQEIWDFERHFNDKYKDKYGAVDKYGKKHLIVSIAHGTGPHFHVQIHSKYKLNIDYKNLD